jgi:PAS domain S-box-containing protein
MTIVLFVVSIFMLNSLLLILHYYNARIGIAPFLLTIGAFTVLAQVQAGIYIQPSPDLLLFLSSTMLIPLVLAGILILYVVNGTSTARLAIYYIIITTFTVLFVQIIFRLQLSQPDSGIIGQTGDIMTPVADIRTTFSGLAAFIVDMFVIAVFYQGIRNYAPYLSEIIRVGLSLLAALWADALVFRLLSLGGTPEFFEVLPGDVVGKTFVALVLWLPMGVYLRFVAPHLSGYIGNDKRRTFDLLFGAGEAMKLSLIRVEAALEKSETERREQAAYFEQIADNIQEALWLLELQPTQPPHITYFNPAYDRILGLNAEARKNPQLLLERVYDEDRDTVRVGLERRLSAIHDMEYRIIHPDGKTRCIRERTIPIRNEQGVVYRIAGISEDITSRKNHEKQQLEFELQHERVKLLQDFISETSHDLKSPLTAINLKLFRLVKSEDADNRQQLGKEISQQTQRMSRMIDDLLTLARADSSLDHAYTPLNLNAIVTAVYDELTAAAQAKHHTVLLELADNLPMLAGNQDDLMRVVHNLLDNAILYTPSGGQISLKTQVIDHNILFRIKDTGIGIPENKLPQVFDRFFRADNAQALQAGGTGLGLAIVKKFVEQHSGNIECVSVEGTGTMFTVRLPLAP